MPETYEQADEQGINTPGWDCANCGLPGFEHDKRRVSLDGDRFGYRYVCPVGDGDA